VKRVAANGFCGRAAIAAAFAMRYFGKSHQILVDASGLVDSIVV
jgi:hypothetical protein